MKKGDVPQISGTAGGEISQNFQRSVPYAPR